MTVAELQPVRAPLRAPFTVCLWITDYCNLDCTYCYAKPFSGRRMDSVRLLELIDEFVEMGVFDLTLAGGEPTLHPAMLDVIERCVKGGIRVGVLSNGVALSDPVIHRLEEMTSPENFLLQVSIDSTDPTINDAARGKTHRVVASLEKLRKSSLDIQLACVVHKKNLKTAHNLIDQYYPDIRRFHFLNIQRTESALKHPELLIDEAEALDFWLGLNEYAKGFPDDLFLPSLRIQMRTLGQTEVDPDAAFHREASFDCAACSAGWTHVNLTTDFDLLGCDIAKDHSYMGNCRTASFTEIWHSAEADAVRNAPFPACYKIAGPDGSRLEEQLKSDYLARSVF